jgi:branched-chain amino acid transport system substrate-binding protein
MGGRRSLESRGARGDTTVCAFRESEIVGEGGGGSGISGKRRLVHQAHEALGFGGFSTDRKGGELGKEDTTKNPSPEESSLSRREFLKMAGVAGAVVGAGAGLGGLLAACGGGTTTTSAGGAPTTAGATTTTAGAATPTTAAAATTTSASAAAETGDTVKLGYVIPITGASGAFGTACKWHASWFEQNVWKDGLVCGDGKKHPVNLSVADMQTDTNRAAQVAGDLITNTKVSLLGGSSGVAVPPVRDQAEALGCPCVTYDCPGEMWNDVQPKEGFKWNWNTWFIFKDMVANYLGLWGTFPTNKVVGTVFGNDATGIAFQKGLVPAFTAAGYKVVDAGLYPPGTEDYSQMISLYKKEGCQILVGVPTPPDFSVFWKQSVQQGLRVKISTEAQAMLFPQGVEALGDLGKGQTVECWFHPSFGYKSTVTGLTSQEVADLYSQATNQQWTQPVCFFGQFEIFTSILSRAKDPLNKDSIVEAIKQTKITTIGGPVDWTVNPEPYSGWHNYCTKPITGAQWVQGKGKYKYDLEIVVSATTKEIKTTAPMIEVQYPS